MGSGPQTTRIDRLLANMGYGSRREIAMMANAGWLTLDGIQITKVDARITLTPDLSSRLCVRGKPLDPLPGMALMVHKPLGVTCSRKESGSLIYDLLPNRWRAREPALSTIGRLDKETSGLILITDDGDFLHRVISPRRHVAKRYVVTLDRPLIGTEAEVFASGKLMLEGEDKPLLPAELNVIGTHCAHLIIHEGRYHQVRRMFAAMGNYVTALHRDRIGGLDLPSDLQIGQIRILTSDDIEQIFRPSYDALEITR
jgi:16S rRNA pseudouridine516 synthase